MNVFLGAQKVHTLWKKEEEELVDHAAKIVVYAKMIKNANCVMMSLYFITTYAFQNALRDG